MNVEFDAPDGYVEPVVNREMPEAPSMPFVPPVVKGPFSGAGVRLDGKAGKPRTTSTSSLGAMAESTSTARPTTVEELPPVVPDENYRPGSLEFIRYNYKCRSVLSNAHTDQSKLA